jgi:aspartokinase/homoserine dehydrogenase 1
MKVAKFGGTSVGSPEAIARIVDIVRSAGPRIVVVSAFSGVTNELVAIAEAAATDAPLWRERREDLEERHRSTVRTLLSDPAASETLQAVDSLLVELRELLHGVQLIRELSARTRDLVMSFGERLCAIILAAAFRRGGLEAEAVDARELIIAGGDFGNARPLLPETSRAIEARFGSWNASGGDPMPVITGFIASTVRGETVTLGRGGSDFTATILGSVLRAEEVEIWTDVNGIMTADPDRVPDAFSLESISYSEAMELSHFGARVIYPPTIQPALERSIPIRILNTFEPAFPGTVIRRDAAPSRYPVRGVASISSIALLRLQGPGMIGVPGIANRLFGSLARRKISIVLISQASSEQSICFAIAKPDRPAAIDAILEEFEREIATGAVDRPVAEGDKAILAVVGERMKRTPGISGRVFHALGRNGINVSAIAQGSSELNISAVVDAEDESKALAAVHEAFFLAGTRSANVLLVGRGLIGGTLIDQIRRHRSLLAEDYSVRLNVVGISDSKRMILDARGIGLEDWKRRLDAEGESAHLDAFLARARNMKLPNTVFVDCTASERLPAIYQSALRYSMAVITPNKKGNSGPLGFYRELMATAMSTGSPYLYETTAGAGLPVISTLHDLQVSGDRITRIEATLSGTIGYVLSNYSKRGSFAELVAEAKALGYTEPDPRDDLSAADPARKALILARELGYELEFKDIRIEPLVPPSCMKAADTEEFIRNLAAEEPYFLALRERAKSRGKELVYAAVIEGGSISLGLRDVGPGDPLFGLRDAENAVAFTTERYSSLPLVVRGPGAGGEVTAGGLFADIVRVAKSLV